MMGGSESGSGEKDGVHTLAIHVPIGWQRRAEEGHVLYVSPSGTPLSSLEEVRTYLSTDGTCKCGLECPLVIHKVFNFSLGIKVQPYSQPLGKTEQDMTKLCNHRRKVVAMAALCRSMQASQLPYVAHHPEVVSGVVEHRDPKRMRVDREDEDRGTYPPKHHHHHHHHHLVQSRQNSNLNPNPCGSPRSSPQLMYLYNGSSPLLHTSTNSNHHPPEVLRRLPPPLTLPPNTSQFPGYGPPQRSPRTPTPQNLSQGQRVIQTLDTPSSPRLGGPLSSPPPPSSPGTLGAGRGTQSHPYGVIVGGSPLSPPSPSVSMTCPSPHRRSRHPSASSLSDQGGGGGGGMLAGYPLRRKSSSSSPHSPLPGGSPNLPSFSKYKLEDILEQIKNSGNNSSTNNNHHILHSNSLTNQSNPQILSLALEKGGRPTKVPGTAPGPGSGLGMGAAGPSGLPLSPFLNHQRQPHPASFPASSLLSAAAKAQLASQLTQSSTEVSKETQQSKVTNSTLHHNNSSSSSSLPSSIARPPPPSPTASFLLPPHPLAQSLGSSAPLHLSSSPTERTAQHRKRQRRSPTVLSMLKESQLNSARTPSPLGSDAINLSALHSTPSSTSASASALALTNPFSSSSSAMPENHLQALRLSVRQSFPLTGPQRQAEALDYTTISSGHPDPPTQPLSALLHLLSVQNAHAAQASAQPGSGSGSGTGSGSGSGLGPGHSIGSSSTRQSPRQSPSPSHLNIRPFPTHSPSRSSSTHSTSSHPLSPSQSKPRQSSSTQSPSRPHSRASPSQRRSPSTALSNTHSVPHRSSPSSVSHTPDRLQHSLNHMDPMSQSLVAQASPLVGGAGEMDTTVTSTTTSPKPLDLSNHVLALLAASSTVPLAEGGAHCTTATTPPGHNTTGPEDPQTVDHDGSTVTKPPGGGCSPDPGPHCNPSSLGDASGPLPLAEAFPFMNQEQLLQLLSTTAGAGLPSLLDPTFLGSLPLGGLGLWQQHHHHQLSDQQQQQQHSEQQQQILIQQESHQEHQHKQQQNNHNSSLFTMLPSLIGAQGELPLNLLGLLNPLLPPTPGQDGDMGLAEKPGLQALLMASLLLGQQHAAMLPLSGLGQLSLDLPPLQQHQLPPGSLEGLSLDKGSGLLDPSSLPGPWLLEALQALQGLQGLLPPAEGPSLSLQALQSLLPPPAFLSLSPALLTAALGTTDLPPNPQLPPTQQPQLPQSQVSHLSSSPGGPDGGDTLIPLSVQGKDNPVLQQLLPTLLNPGVLGDLSALTSLHSLLGLGAGSLLLPSVQASALGMPLLQDHDGAINLINNINNIQLNMAPPTEGEKAIPMQETDDSAPREDIPANQLAREPISVPSPCPAPPTTQAHSAPQRGEGSAGRVLDPYASFMDTIYTSFLQVSAKEQEAAAAQSGGGSGVGGDTLCALPPSSYSPGDPPSTLPQASAPFSLSPRRACSLRNPDLSRLNMEAAAHSPAQGTPKPSSDGFSTATPPQSKPGAATDTPLPPIYLEEAKTDSVGAVCPYGNAAPQRQGDLPQAGGYLSPRGGGSNCPKEETGGLQHTEQAREPTSQPARRGRKRKQTLQNVLEDFRDMDAIALEEPKPTVVLLKPERSVRGRRRRGARSQRQ